MPLCPSFPRKRPSFRNWEFSCEPEVKQMFTGTSLFVSSCKTRMEECLCFGSMQIKIIYSGKKEKKKREEEYNFQGTCSVSIVYVLLTMRMCFLFCLFAGGG